MFYKLHCRSESRQWTVIKRYSDASRRAPSPAAVPPECRLPCAAAKLARSRASTVRVLAQFAVLRDLLLGGQLKDDVHKIVFPPKKARRPQH